MESVQVARPIRDRAVALGERLRPGDIQRRFRGVHAFNLVTEVNLPGRPLETSESATKRQSPPDAPGDPRKPSGSPPERRSPPKAPPDVPSERIQGPDGRVAADPAVDRFAAQGCRHPKRGVLADVMVRIPERPRLVVSLVNQGSNSSDRSRLTGSASAARNNAK